jgi:flagellar hook-associated protein 2
LPISSPGIGSNLDINGIVAKLMQAEAMPLNLLAKKEASYQAKLSAFGTLSGSLSAFKDALTKLNTQSTFQSLTATPSDKTVFNASATAAASSGNYSINVTKLAQAQTLASTGVASTTSAIGTGKLVFQFGTTTGTTFTQDATKGSGEVTIDSSNSSMQGIRDAINKANLGVTATIVSDGSAAPNRLVIKSDKTGATSSMKIDVQGGDAALTNLLAYDPAGTKTMTETSVAQNAELTVNGIAVSSQTNSVSGAIEGVTLDLAKLGASELNVKLDTTAVTAAVNGLIKTYNDLASTIKNVSGYNSGTREAGVLLGDSSVRNVESQVRKLLSSAATGSNSSLRSLGEIGISIDKNGTMSLDSSKLSKAMDKNVTDVAALFSSIGKATDSLVSFSSASAQTKPGTYDVFVSRLATQGNVVGTKDLRTGSIAIDNTNKDLSFTIDGITASVSMVPGTSYTGTQIAAQLQSAINGTAAFSKEGIGVSVTIDSATGFMNITSNRYGSASKVNISGAGTSVSNLMNTPAAAVDGVDVAGTIGGVVAAGSGQFLTGASAAEGLKLQISGGAVNVSRGSVTFSQGYAFHLNNLVDGFLGSKGLIAGRTDGIKSSIKDLGKASESMNDRLAAMEKRYRAQFTALDVAISNMSSTSAFLAQQLAQLSNMS